MNQAMDSASAARTLSELRVYNRSRELAKDISALVRLWPWPDRHDAGRQAVRCSNSISANIAEAYGRHYAKEKQRFLFYARGSARELEGWLNAALDSGLITADTHRHHLNRVVQIVRMLNAYIRVFNTRRRTE